MIKHVIYNIPWKPTPHPKQVFHELGITYERAEPNSYQECWHLFNVKGLPDPLPEDFKIIEQSSKDER